MELTKSVRSDGSLSLAYVMLSDGPWTSERHLVYIANLCSCFVLFTFLFVFVSSHSLFPLFPLDLLYYPCLYFFLRSPQISYLTSS